ncbi:MAG TPA: AgmX/PglI C-terminal domain-containing protein [Kofleriaceae bacterium]
MKTISRLSTAALVVSACFGIAAADVPEGLDRKAISDGINSVKPKVLECAKSSPDVKGKVKVKVVVAPAGTVTSATITDSPDDDLGQCVAAAVKAAMFCVTKKGGAFSYPFVF